MRAVADAVGINIATLHYHVTTKDDLLALVTDEIRADFIAQHEQRGLSGGKGAIAQLNQEFSDFSENRVRRPILIAAFAELSRHASRDEEVARRIHPLRDAWIAGFEKILRAGIEEGVFRDDLDTPAFATLIAAALGGFGGEAASNDPTVMSRIFAELMRSVLSPEGKETFDGNA